MTQENSSKQEEEKPISPHNQSAKTSAGAAIGVLVMIGEWAWDKIYNREQKPKEDTNDKTSPPVQSIIEDSSEVKDPKIRINPDIKEGINNAFKSGVKVSCGSTPNQIPRGNPTSMVAGRG